jgi:hypothetical protein
MAWEAFHLWEADRPTVVAVDTETHGLGWFDRAFCATVTWAADPESPGCLRSGYFRVGAGRGRTPPPAGQDAG